MPNTMTLNAVSRATHEGPSSTRTVSSPSIATTMLAGRAKSASTALLCRKATRSFSRSCCTLAERGKQHLVRDLSEERSPGATSWRTSARRGRARRHRACGRRRNCRLASQSSSRTGRGTGRRRRTRDRCTGSRGETRSPRVRDNDPQQRRVDDGHDSPGRPRVPTHPNPAPPGTPQPPRSPRSSRARSSRALGTACAGPAGSRRRSGFVSRTSGRRRV